MYVNPHSRRVRRGLSRHKSFIILKIGKQRNIRQKADWCYCKENTRLFVPNEPSYSTSTSTIQISSISPTRKLEDQQSFRITPLFWDGLSPQFSFVIPCESLIGGQSSIVLLCRHIYQIWRVEGTLQTWDASLDLVDSTYGSKRGKVNQAFV